jgi:hypothetical protein
MSGCGNRLKGIALLIALNALVHGCQSDKSDPGPEREVGLGLYAGEDATWSEIEQALPLMARHAAALQIAIPVSDIGSDQLAGLLRQANAQGVELRLWPLVAFEDGYWPNETNIDIFAATVRQLLDWLEEEQITATTVIYDMEPAFEYSKQISAAYVEGLAAAVELMRGHLDRDAFLQARDRLVASVREVQQRGLRVQCVTFPQVLDDLDDGDDDLQDAMDIPVAGVPWDEVAFMVYQSSYARFMGAWVGSALIESYSGSARTHFGERATMALGVVGAVGITPSEEYCYREADLLAEDAAAARFAGIERIEIYSLDGILLNGDPDAWLATAGVEPKKPLPSFNAELARTAIATLDELLEKPAPADAGPGDGGADAGL